MWREAGLVRIGMLWVVSVAAVACGGGTPPPDSPVDTSASAQEPQPVGPAHELDVNMSFSGGDESDSESAEEASRRYTPPPTRTYSPAAPPGKVSEAEQPEKK